LSAVPDKARRYRVSGIDERGDVQALETDDRERAGEMKRNMADRLSDVRIEDRSAWRLDWAKG